MKREDIKKGLEVVIDVDMVNWLRNQMSLSEYDFEPFRNKVLSIDCFEGYSHNFPLCRLLNDDIIKKADGSETGISGLLIPLYAVSIKTKEDELLGHDGHIKEDESLPKTDLEKELLDKELIAMYHSVKAARKA